MVGCPPTPMALGTGRGRRMVWGSEWWWWLDFVEQPQTGCGWGMGAEDQSFLLLKCNKSIRELVGGGQGSGDPAVQAAGSCALRGTTTWGGGGVEWAEGWGGAPPVGATLSTPFLINQSWFTFACSLLVLFPVGVLDMGGEGGPDTSGPEHLLGCGRGPPGNPGLPVLYGCPHSYLTALTASPLCAHLSSEEKTPNILQL